MANWYSLDGALLRVDAGDEALEEPLRVYLDELRTSPCNREPDFKLVIERGTPQEPPAEARLVYERPRQDAPICRYSAAGHRRWFTIPDRLSLEYSITDNVARMCAAPGDEWLIGGTAGIHALYAMLHVTGQMLVHAAALRLPRTDAALVLFAPSGAGKTTTSLALAIQEYGLLTDDATVLKSGEPSTATCVWGLPRPPKVHHRTAALLPQLGGLLGPKWNAEGEQALSPAALRSLVQVQTGASYPLAALVLLGARVSGPHVFRPMRKSEAFVHFVNDNIFRSPAGLMNDNLARYHRFAQIVTATPAYELNVGSDLCTLGETIAAGLEPADQAILSA